MELSSCCASISPQTTTSKLSKLASIRGANLEAVMLSYLADILTSMQPRSSRREKKFSILLVVAHFAFQSQKIS